MSCAKPLQIMFLSFSMLCCAVAQTPDAGKQNTLMKPEDKIESCEPPTLVIPKTEAMKTIAEGANSKIETPFVFVARDAKTFELLKSSVDNLPDSSAINFSKAAVVAVFAGKKNTGGFSIGVKRSGENYSVEILSPPAGAIVTEALTSPYKILLTPVEAEKSLELSVSEDFRPALKTYKIVSGEFEYSGGFAFRQKKFAADGTIELMQSGELVTLDFNLSGKGAGDALKLSETASGILKNGKIELSRLDAGSFSEGPKPPVRVSGLLNGDKIKLTFEPLPTTVADGFSVNGKLEAVKN